MFPGGFADYSSAGPWVASGVLAGLLLYAIVRALLGIDRRRIADLETANAELDNSRRTAASLSEQAAKLEAEHNRAAIWEVDPASGAHRLFASGLRNPNGLTFRPGSNELFAVVNERDEIGNNQVPDYMTSVKDGGFYGWPWSYYGQHVDIRVHPQRPEMVARAISPDFALGPHVAALGLVFSNGTMMPPKFQGGAFVGEHGSWDRTQFNGYQVIYVPFVDGKPSGKPVPFVTGFIDPKSGDTRGRPVGVALDSAGALLVADDVGHAIWRVTPVPVPGTTKLGN